MPDVQCTKYFYYCSNGIAYLYVRGAITRCNSAQFIAIIKQFSFFLFFPLPIFVYIFIGLPCCRNDFRLLEMLLRFPRHGGRLLRLHARAVLRSSVDNSPSLLFFVCFVFFETSFIRHVPAIHIILFRFIIFISN